MPAHSIRMDEYGQLSERFRSLQSQYVGRCSIVLIVVVVVCSIWIKWCTGGYAYEKKKSIQSDDRDPGICYGIYRSAADRM